MRLSHPDDIDDRVEAWLCEALRRGDQETLDPDAEVEPLTGRSLELFRTAFRVRVDSSGEELVAKLPGHVAQALALVDQVVARVSGVEYPARLYQEAGKSWVPIERGTGLGIGEQADLYLRVDV